MLYLGKKQFIPANQNYDTLTMLNVTEVVNRVTVNRDTVDQFTIFADADWLAVDIVGVNTFQIDVELALEPDSDALDSVFVCGERSDQD
jgi:flavin-binding protein dodecin